MRLSSLRAPLLGLLPGALVCPLLVALLLVPMPAPFAISEPTPVYAEEAPGQKPHIFAYCDTGHATLDPCFYGKDSPDPAHDERILVSLLEPLTVIDPESLEVRPGTAESWHAEDGGRTWVFKIRQNAVWQDGTPVVAKHFIESWRRTLDPFRNSPWSGLFRALKGCADISGNARMATALGQLRSALKALIKQNQAGIPGEELNAMLDELGTRPFLRDVKGRAIKRMLKWDNEEQFSPENVENALEKLKVARRKVKRGLEDAIENFGTEAGGIYAKDDHTLVVKTDGIHPYLPELMARGAFCPMHPSYERNRDKLFSRQQYYMSCGPYTLFGRGPKPPEGLDKDVQSLVHLKINDKYTGPNKANMAEIYCYTDQGRGEDVRLFKDGASQFVRMTWKEYPRDPKPAKKKKKGKGKSEGDAKKKPRPNERKMVEGIQGYQVVPSTRVMYLRFRCDRPPFDNKNARIAFASSIRREHVAKVFWPEATPSDRIVPAGVKGRVDDLDVPGENTKAAKAAFENSGIDSETWIEISYAGVPGHLEASDFLRLVSWAKGIEYEPSSRMEDKKTLLQTRRSGQYTVMLTESRGFANDPYAFLAGFHSHDPDGGLGWKDKVFDMLLDAAKDPDKALADKAGWLAKVKIGALQGPATAAINDEGKLKFRLACLAQAEKRLLDEFVVVPLVVLNEAEFHSGFQGFYTKESHRYPGFVGALHTVKK